MIEKVIKDEGCIAAPWMWTLAFGHHEDRSPTHGYPMQGDEIRTLRRPQREQRHRRMSYERGDPMSAKSFGTLFERLGRRAGMPFTIFPHMLRHACGYALANTGHDTRALQAWLGHKNIQHTVRYTELAPDRFKNFWR
jgi:site-specific recombinase XerD